MAQIAKGRNVWNEWLIQIGFGRDLSECQSGTRDKQPIRSRPRSTIIRTEHRSHKHRLAEWNNIQLPID
jgi:hypothetical protein